MFKDKITNLVSKFANNKTIAILQIAIATITIVQAVNKLRSYNDKEI